MVGMLKTTIDLSAIAHNVRLIKEKVGPEVKLMCVVKADAYGHGAAKVVPVMARAGADCFGVATLREAVDLRRAGVDAPIVAWIWQTDEILEEALANGIEVAVNSLEQAHKLVKADFPAEVYVKVETGMHRSGVDEGDWAETFKVLRDAPHIKVLGLMSHFACADEPDNPHNDAQEEAFRTALQLAREIGLECPVNHLANSPAVLTLSLIHI